MSTSMLLGLFDWIGDFFKSLFDLIPKIMYLLYASMACVLDVLQLFFRKLAGLDVYWVDGKAVGGDLVTNFITGILGINKDNITYSALSTVFWSMVVFGVIICFASTIIAIIKSHYSYDEKAAKGPMQYVYTAGKAILNMVVVPIVVVLGLYVSEALLTALDTITSTNSGTIVEMFGSQTSMLTSVDTAKNASGAKGADGKQTYIRYDIFGFDCNIRYGNSYDNGWTSDHKDSALVGATSQPFSGSLFRVAAYNGNRVRLGQLNLDSIAYDNGDNLFSNASGGDTDVNGRNKKLAEMVDMAFACNLKLEQTHGLDYGGWGGFISFRYFTNYLTRNVSSYSKFNVGLVWYYYDLWQFNFIVGFAGIIVCLSIFINVILGLITRLFMCIVLFLVAPPLFGLAPLDGGKAGKGWRENFMKQALMAYGAVVGMNLVLMILPYMNDIDFFNIPIADYFAQTLVIIVGLITIKAVIATLSGLIGAADANETGGKIAEEVGSVAGKATKMTIGAAKLGVKGLKGTGAAVHAAGHGITAFGAKMSEIRHENAAKKEGSDRMAAFRSRNKINASDASVYNSLRDGTRGAKRQAIQHLTAGGRMTKQEAQETIKAMQDDIKTNGGRSAAFDQSRLSGQLVNNALAHAGSMRSHQSAATRRKATAGNQWGMVKSNMSNAVKGKGTSDTFGNTIGTTKLGVWMSSKGHAIANSKFGQTAGTVFRTGFSAVRDVGSNVGEAMGNAWDAFGENKMIDTFADKSKIRPKPDHAKTSAEQAKRQTQLQEQQMIAQWRATSGRDLTAAEKKHFDETGELPR